MEKLIERLYREMLRGRFAKEVQAGTMRVTPWHETLLTYIQGRASKAINNLYSKEEATELLKGECRTFVESVWVEGMTWEALLPLAVEGFGKA